MRKDRIERTGQYMLNNPIEFNMNYYWRTVHIADNGETFNDNNATEEEWNNHFRAYPSCLAAWVVAVNRNQDYLSYDDLKAINTHEEAQKILGLDSGVANRLFTPYRPRAIMGEATNTPYKATKEEVIRVLDHLIATGDVDWSVAGFYNPSPVELPTIKDLSYER